MNTLSQFQNFSCLKTPPKLFVLDRFVDSSLWSRNVDPLEPTRKDWLSLTRICAVNCIELTDLADLAMPICLRLLEYIRSLFGAKQQKRPDAWQLPNETFCEARRPVPWNLWGIAGQEGIERWVMDVVPRNAKKSLGPRRPWMWLSRLVVTCCYLDRLDPYWPLLRPY